MMFSFNLYNSLAPDGIYIALKRMLPSDCLPPVVLCVGSDLSVGDSLGPIVGSILKRELHNHNVFVYGTLAKPITAHEVNYMQKFLKCAHPGRTVIAVDAAVGSAGDVGLIKVCSSPLNPGSGANKKLTKVGDVSIMGIVAEKSVMNYSLFSGTRLNMVVKMADMISSGIIQLMCECLTDCHKMQSM